MLSRFNTNLIFFTFFFKIDKAKRHFEPIYRWRFLYILFYFVWYFSGSSARLSKRSLGKIVSRAAVCNSFCPEAHYLAAANIDTLYSNAIEPWAFELNPNKVNIGLKNRRYLYALMEYNNKIAVVKITVKEYLDINLQNKLYSIETIDVDLKA